MQKEQIIKILNDVANKKINIEKAMNLLKNLPFEDLGFAKVDHHRSLRMGFPEVIFCKGKTLEQISKIFRALEKRNNNLLLTKANESIFKRLKKINKKISYIKSARAIVLEKKKQDKKGNILVMCAGTADIPIAEEARVTTEVMGKKVTSVYDVGVAGLHRLLAHKEKIFSADVIIAIAGMEGALPSVIAGLASCVVIAVPTSVGYGTNLKGLAPLLTMLNSCSPNVAVVNIDNGFGAGFIASLIIGGRENDR